MKREKTTLLGILGVVLVFQAPTDAQAEGGVPAVNKKFTVVDCGTPIEVLRLYASTVYKHPETGQFHLLLEYGNNNGYAIGEQEWEDTAHRHPPRPRPLARSQTSCHIPRAAKGFS